MVQPNNAQTEKEKAFDEFYAELFGKLDEVQVERLKEWLKNIEHTGFRKVKIKEGIV